MSLFLIKSILSIFFILAGISAALFMLILMGKSEKKISAVFLRRAHRISGAVFAVFLVIISYLCIKYWAVIGDQLSLRAVIHLTLAFGLIILFALKVSIVQFFREFIRFVPVMGMTVLCLAFVVFCLSAGFFFLSSSKPAAKEITEVQKKEVEVSTEGNAERGKSLFETKCSVCHYPNKSESKMGPGLKEILKRKTLPVSGKAATPENIREQLINPYKNMPSFKNDLTKKDIQDLMAYLATL